MLTMSGVMRLNITQNIRIILFVARISSVDSLGKDLALRLPYPP
jgi:hypothetical protein